MMPALLIVCLAMLVAVLIGVSAQRWRVMSGRRARLDAENRLMRETLLWYADRSHWRRGHPRGGRHWDNSLVADDRGYRARLALVRTQRSG